MENLIEYLETKFIPKHILSGIDKDGKFNYVRLGDIYNLKLDDNELETIYKYLHKKNIRIKGKGFFLDECNGSYGLLKKSEKLPLAVSDDINMSNLRKYYETRDLSLRNEIIVENLRLVNYISWLYCCQTGINIQELNSYGYEGLIRAVEKFNPNLGYKFVTLAVKSIRHSILNGIVQIRFGKHYKFYDDYYKAIIYIENKYKMSIQKYPELIDKVVERLVETSIINDTYFARCNARMKLDNFLAKKGMDYNDLGLVDLIDYDEIAETSIMRDIIIQKLDALPEIEKNIIMLKFGLIDNDELNYTEIGRIYNCTGEAIRQRVAKILDKLYYLFSNDIAIKNYVECDNEARLYGREYGRKK